MRKHLLFTAAFLVACAFPGLSFAQPRPNDNELQAAAGFFHAQNADTGSLNADLSYGKFLDRRAVEVGLRLGYVGLYNDKEPDAWTLTAAPFLDYHFLGVSDGDRVVPFVGAFVGPVWDDDEFDGTVGPEAGAKVFVNDRTFLTARYRYEWFFDNLDLGTDASEGNHVVTLGVGFLWGGA